VRCLLVYPRFRVASFWNFGETCKAAGARYPTAPLGLVTVAAMLPPDWDVRLVDRNVHDWRPEDLGEADLVLVGGMIAQQLDALDVIREARARGKRVVVGGPDATSSPDVYREADHLVLGEAEITLPRFLADLAAGRPLPTYETTERADVTASPCPRFDLLDFDRYLYVGVQWCRGCPFSCEFCDIIELYGRVPRAKTTAQMLGELQRLHDLGYRGHVDFVDDNFIGNKRLAKAFLPHLRTWLEARDWPFEFSTEASLNLADDDELLSLMQDVGFFAIFVGIESPDEATLIATKKRQNTHRSIAASVRKIYRHGIFVLAGYIVGFDAERGSVARALLECVEATGIPVNMVGLLYALPNTQLTRRLRAEGRLPDTYAKVEAHQGDQCTAGLNFETLRPRAEILRDYLRVVEEVYEPRRYFARVLSVARELDSSRRRFKNAPEKRLRERRMGLAILRRLLGERTTRRPFLKALLGTLWANPRSLRITFMMSSFYLHLGPFSRFVAERTRGAIAAAERDAAARLPATVAAG
jgi:radical SAM superfamily enzyme YgiQ (UPF0313 family)